MKELIKNEILNRMLPILNNSQEKELDSVLDEVLSKYILGETNKETLNLSVTKLAGPQINEIGNFCITGHNYLNSKMFFKLKQVKKDDEVILTNTYEESVNYKVYEIKEVLPEEVEVLSQDTKEEREVTLITCTFGAIKRIVVKASEVYD